MEANGFKQKQDEWIRKVRLAHYKRLSNALSLDTDEKNRLIMLRQLLLSDGFTEEAITQEALQYGMLNDEEKQKQVDEKIEELVSQITAYLENIEEISSKEKPELYHRIQEILALNPDGGSDLIGEVFEKEKIYRCTVCGDSLYGGGCTYYFSKKPYSTQN